MCIRDRIKRNGVQTWASSAEQYPPYGKKEEVFEIATSAFGLLAMTHGLRPETLNSKQYRILKIPISKKNTRQVVQAA